MYVNSSWNIKVIPMSSVLQELSMVDRILRDKTHLCVFGLTEIDSPA